MDNLKEEIRQTMVLAKPLLDLVLVILIVVAFYHNNLFTFMMLYSYLTLDTLFEIVLQSYFKEEPNGILDHYVSSIVLHSVYTGLIVHLIVIGKLT